MSSTKNNNLNAAVDAGIDSGLLANIDSIMDYVGHSMGPVLNDGYTDDLQPTLSGRLPMGEGHVLRVYCNNVVVGYADIGTEGHWTFKPATPLEPGKAYDFQVVLLDSSGNELQPSNTYTINTTELNHDAAADAPVITEVFDHAGDHQGPVAQGGKTDDKQPTVSGTADAGDVVTVKVYSAVNNHTYTLGSVVADADGHWSYQMHGSQDITNGLGEWTFTATATNVLGTSDSSAGYSVETVASNTDVFATPEISYIIDDVGLHTGQVTDGGKTDDKQPELHGTGEPGSVVTVTMYGPSTGKTYTLGSVTVSNDGTWHYQFTGKQAMQAGNGAENIFHVSSVDTDSHTVTSDAFTVTLTGSNADDNTPADTTPPDAPTIIDFYDDAGDSKGHDTNGGTTDDTTPTLNGQAEANSIVKVYEGSTLLGSTTAKADGSWSYTTPVRADGKHDFTATATDAAGNISAHSGHFVIITEAPDTTPPVQPTIDTFHDEAGNSSSGATSDDSTPTLQGHAEANSIVKVYEGSTLLGSTTAHSDGTWSYTTPVRADGKHDFTATATDAARNVSAHSGDFVVNIDTAPVGVSGFEDFETSEVDGYYFTSLTTDSGLKVESAERTHHYSDIATVTITPENHGKSNLYIADSDSGLIKFTLPGVADTVSLFGFTPDNANIHAYDANGHEVAVTVTMRESTKAEILSHSLLLDKYTITPVSEQHIASFTAEGFQIIDDVSWASANAQHANLQSALLTTPDAVDHHDIMTLPQIDDSHKSTAAVDITDHVQNTLHLTLNDILSEAHPNLFVQDGKQQLAVTGDQGDVVELKVDDLAHNTWQDSGAVTAGGIQYEVYQHAGSDVELLVQHGLELHQVS